MTDPIPELIESSILVDPKMVGELQHRWNCYQVMLEALKAVSEMQADPKHFKIIDKVCQAIAKAERKE